MFAHRIAAAAFKSKSHTKQRLEGAAEQQIEHKIKTVTQGETESYKISTVKWKN